VKCEVKICGVTQLEDAVACVRSGADAIGINFWPGTPRVCNESTAQAIVDAVGDSALVIGVFVDATLEHIQAIRQRTGLRWVQLHGREPATLVQALLPEAYKALPVTDAAVIDEARAYPGEHVLLDTYVAGVPGGTGQIFNWEIAKVLAHERKLTLAGGLTPTNVAQAIRTVRPFRVDVASGVEQQPGKKDLDLVQALIQAVRGTDDDDTR
jgi:phosphoribosylanthranilate isomerase